MGSWAGAHSHCSFFVEHGGKSNRVGEGKRNMNYRHWLGVLVLLLIGYYAGTKGWLAPVLAQVGIDAAA
jgi:hypothetical protein